MLRKYSEQLFQPNEGVDIDPRWVSRGLKLAFTGQQRLWVNGFWRSNQQTSSPKYSPTKTGIALDPTSGFISGVPSVCTTTGHRSFVFHGFQSGNAIGRVFQDSSGDGITEGEGLWLATGGPFYLRTTTTGVGYKQFTNNVWNAPNNTWYSIGITHDQSSLSNNLTQYANGRLHGTVIDTAGGTGAYKLGSGTISIGNRVSPSDRAWPGFIRSLLIFDSLLTDAEHKELADDPNAIFAPRPVHLFHFSEAAASPISNKPLTRHIDRVSQPQDAVEVDRSSSFSRELVLSVAAIPGLTQNPASRIEVHPVGAPTSVFTSRGSAASLTSAGGLFAFSNSLLDLPADFTMSAWIYISSTPTAHRIFSKGTSGVTWESYIFGVGVTPSGQQRFGVQFRTGNSETPRYWAEQVGYITQNGWYRVIGTHDGTTISLYINGMLDHAGAGNSSGPYINTSRLFIGGHYNNTPAYTTQALNYPVQDARIYRRCWTAEEVRRDYAQSWQLFAKEEKFIQTAYAPKAPWSVAKSRVLGTSTGAPATVATAGIVQVPWERQPQTAVGLDIGGPLKRPFFVFNAASGPIDLAGTFPASTSSPTFYTSKNGIGVAGSVISFALPEAVPNTNRTFTAVGSVQIRGTGVTERVFIAYETIAALVYFIEVNILNTRQIQFRIRNSSTNVRSVTHATIYPIGTIVNFCVTGRGGSIGDITLYANDEAEIIGGSVGWSVHISNVEIGQAGGVNSTSLLALYHGSHSSKAKPEVSAKDFVKNPWQVFAPHNLQIPVGVNA